MLRVYSETLPYEVVRARETLALLSKRGLSLVLAARPWDVPALRSVVVAASEASVPLSIWPMLSDHEGRWASSRNARAFVELVGRVVSAAVGVDGGAPEILFDLEPPFEEGWTPLRGLTGLSRLVTGAGRADFEAATRILSRCVESLHARAISTSAAVWPLVLFDVEGSTRWQALLGTPVDALATRRVSVMLYTSILEGWSRGALRRPDAAALLSRLAARAATRFGASAGISLGCVGTGAFGDEPVYRSPDELAEDVGLARRAGCEDLSLFDLGGVLSRRPAEAWLDAFTTPARAVVAPTSRRVEAASRILSAPRSFRARARCRRRSHGPSSR